MARLLCLIVPANSFRGGRAALSTGMTRWTSVEVDRREAVQPVEPPARLVRPTPMRGDSHTFDSFECAIRALAPKCAHCGCRVIGHGTEKDGRIYCCAHCAHEAGAKEIRDRA